MGEAQDNFRKVIFDAMYVGAMGEGGDGSALLKCKDQYNTGIFTYTKMADEFEKFLIENHDYAIVDNVHERTADNKEWINPFDKIPKDKHPFSRHFWEHENVKVIVFQMLPETGFVFQEGWTSRKTDDWKAIVINI